MPSIEAGPKFERLRFVVGQEHDEDAEQVTDSLHKRGIERVANCNGSTDRLFNALDTEIVDLLLYDYSSRNDNFARTMQQVRRKVRGRNPFVIIVATVGDSTVETVRRLMRAGVDDLIRRPVTAQRLYQSIDTMMHRRKPFSVSYEYVGPVRGTAPGTRLRATESRIRVPNTMRSRAIENVSEDELQQMVAQAVASLDDKVLIACGSEIDVNARALLAIYESHDNRFERLDEISRLLDEIERASDELYRRSQGTPFERIGDLAKMSLALVQRVRRGSLRRASTEAALLGKLGEAIRRALSVERDAVGIMRDISDAIASFTGRG